MEGYEGVALQYYYRGNLKVANYYLDRLMRGKFEKKESRIREIYMKQLDHRRKEKGRFDPFADNESAIQSTIENITRKAQNSMQRNRRATKRFSTQMSFASSGGTSTAINSGSGGFSQVVEFYNNAFIRDKQPLQIRKGTPISDARSSEFPSPRVGKDDGSIDQNYSLLPWFDEGKIKALMQKELKSLEDGSQVRLNKKLKARQLPG